MCLGCNDADRREEALKEAPHCRGDLKPQYTMDQLKEYVVGKWIECGQENFNIYRNGIIDAPQESYSWTASNGKELSIKFLTL